jgi:hypothetical protein
MNEFAAHEQLRAAPGLNKEIFNLVFISNSIVKLPFSYHFCSFILKHEYFKRFIINR